MNQFKLFTDVCQECSEHITKRYSTSFSAGIKVFDVKLRAPIYAIYGFVRFADEIVDTFHEYDNTCTNFLMELNEVIIQCCY